MLICSSSWDLMNAKWKKTGWTVKLSTLLSGHALDVYSRLSEEIAMDYMYDKMKPAPMKQTDESPDQFIVHLTTVYVPSALD